MNTEFLGDDRDIFGVGVYRDDSSTFYQNIRACLKSCSEMSYYGKHLLQKYLGHPQEIQYS
jgi:hypothetical protein